MKKLIFALPLILIFSISGCSKSLGEIKEDFRDALQDAAEDAIEDSVFGNFKDELDALGEQVQEIIDEIRGKE